MTTEATPASRGTEEPLTATIWASAHRLKWMTADPWCHNLNCRREQEAPFSVPLYALTPEDVAAVNAARMARAAPAAECEDCHAPAGTVCADMDCPGKRAAPPDDKPSEAQLLGGDLWGGGRF